MIFIISLTLIENLNDKIKLFTPLTMNNITRWGEIPGTLNYTYNKEVYLFNINNMTDAGEINMTSVGPLNYSVARHFNNPIYDDAKKVVNYTTSHSYTLQNENSDINDT